MATKHLSGDYPGGYTLSPHYSKLVIAETAYVGGGGVTADAFATIVNHGAVESSHVGVYLKAGGLLINGSTKDTSASIVGYIGVYARDGAFVANFGTIATSSTYGAGVILPAGGSVTNGSARDTAALIYGGVSAKSDASIGNFGTIEAAGGEFFGAGAGVTLGEGGRVTNGSRNDATALIAGYDFGLAGFNATVVNYGTIRGADGVSVNLYGGGGEVFAYAGSAFVGTIEGGGGMLGLAGSGAGTISGLGGTGTLSGAVDGSFTGFGAYEIRAGAAWTLAGSDTLNAGDDLVDAGMLVDRGALTIGGTLTIENEAVFRLAAGGSIAAGQTGQARIIDNGLMIKNPGTGNITVNAKMFDRGVVEAAGGVLEFTGEILGTGVLQIDAGAALQADDAAVNTLAVAFTGSGATLALKLPNRFNATIGGFATGDAIDLLAITATGARVNGADKLVIVNGAKTVATLQLSGDYAGATFTTVSDGNGGTSVELVSPGAPNLPSVPAMAAAMASLAGPAGAPTAIRALETGWPSGLAAPHLNLQ